MSKERDRPACGRYISKDCLPGQLTGYTPNVPGVKVGMHAERAVKEPVQPEPAQAVMHDLGRPQGGGYPYGFSRWVAGGVSPGGEQ